MDLVCTWLTGPDSGAEQRITWHPGPEGDAVTAIIGSNGPFACDDPGLQPHHVVVEARAPLGTATDASARAQLWVTQLAGTRPAQTHDGPLRGRTAVASGTRLALADSTCRIDVVETPAAACGPHTENRTPGRPHLRAPRRIPSPSELAVARHLEAIAVGSGTGLAPRGHDDLDIALPERERPGGLMPTLVGVAGAGVVAVVTGRPMFLLFGAIGSLVALTSWAGQWIAFRRRHRRAVDAHRAGITARAADRAAARGRDRMTITAITPSIERARAAIAAQSSLLWACRASDPDAFLVGLGIGDVRRGPGASPVDDTIVDVPVPAWLGPGERLAVVGPSAYSIARSIIVQLAMRCGPADVRLIVDADDFHWASCLPHVLCETSTSRARPLDHDDVADLVRSPPPGHLVVVTTRIAALGDPSSAVRQLLDHTSASMLSINDDGPAPPGATALLDTRCSPAVFTPDIRRGSDALPVSIAGLGTRAASECATTIGLLRDPEAADADTRALPPSVDLDELGGARQNDPMSIISQWSTSPSSLRLPIGVMVDRSGPATAWLDLVADGPHALVAGTTGSGKSELLRSMVVGLARSASPQQLSMVLVDFKGGAAFDALAPLPHVAAVITDLDDRLADRMLRSLHAEMRSREALLRRVGASDIDTAHARGGTSLPRLVIIVDEFAALVSERPSFLHALVGIAQRGRSLGLHLVLATQRPAGVVSDDIRANTAMRIALRLHDRSDALDVVGDDAPVSFPSRTPGRAMLRDGDRRIVVQTAHCSRLHDAVDALRTAAVLSGCSPPLPPWMPPLPECLDDLPDVARTGWDTSGMPTPSTTPVLGIIDDPDHQRLLPLVIPDGPLSLIVAGSRGMGVSSTLAAVAAAAAPRYERVVVIASSVGESPWRALDDDGIVEHVSTDDDRLLCIMRHQLGHSRASGRQRTLVVLDGLESLRRVLAGPAHDHRVERRHESRFDQLLGAVLHPDADVDLAVGTADPGGLPSPVLSRCDERWLLHLTDPSPAAALGVPPRAVPPAVPGRLLIAGLDAQVLAPAAIRHRTASAPRHRARLVPTREPLALSALLRDTGGSPLPDDVVPLGVDLETGLVAGLSVGIGDAVLVIGQRAADRAAISQSVCAAVAQCRPSQRVLHVETSAIATGQGELHDQRAAPGSLADVVVISGTGYDIRRREGWWTGLVRRARRGVILDGPDAHADGELLGVVLPRGFPARSHPHRAWLVDHGSIAPVHLAAEDTPTEPDPTPALLPLSAAWRPLSGTSR